MAHLQDAYKGALDTYSLGTARCLYSRLAACRREPAIHRWHWQLGTVFSAEHFPCAPDRRARPPTPNNPNPTLPGPVGPPTTTTFVGPVFTPGSSQVVYWDSSNSNAWIIGANWSDGFLPFSLQTLIIDTSYHNVSLLPLVILGPDTNNPGGDTIANLVIGPGAELDIVDGGALTVLNIVDVFAGGTIEVAGDPPILILPGTVYNAGTIQAGAPQKGGEILLFGGAIVGGTVSIVGAGLIDVLGSSVIADSHITSSGTLQVDGLLALDGTRVSGGTLTITATGLVHITGATTIDGSAVLTGGPITIEKGQTLTLDGATLSSDQVTLVAGAGYVGLNALAPLAINGAGQVVGTYTDSSGVHGFIYDPSISANPISLNGPSTGTSANQSASALGINDAGQVVGSYADSSGIVHGFIYDPYGGTSYTKLDDPLAAGNIAGEGHESRCHQ